MRNAKFWTLVVATALVARGSGLAAEFNAIIQRPTVEVRGGQSTVFPVTGYLRQQQTIRVLREEGGWLAIAPPAGSSSWIMERVLDQQPQPGRSKALAVLAADVPVLLGTQDRAAPHPTQVGTVGRGTIVVVLGEKCVSDALGEKTTWWRIQPTVGEVRWISRDAINGAVPTAPVSPPTSVASAPPVIQPAATLTSRQSALMNIPAPSGGWPAGVVMTSGPGTLRRASFQIEGQRAYVLEDTYGNPRLYVIGQQGINLDPFVNRQVEMFGPMANRAELTAGGYMSVGKLHLLR
ncbi:MAG: hypothetical protein ACJ8C4_18880 [Gemmataceae bacterium]